MRLVLAAVVPSVEDDVEARVGGSYSRLDLSRRNIEQRTIESCASLIGREDVVQKPVTIKIIQRGARVASHRSGIAEPG